MLRQFSRRTWQECTGAILIRDLQDMYRYGAKKQFDETGTGRRCKRGCVVRKE
jgi:hypothetical protein